ncbi:MAG: transglutaminase domain-containing protein [Thermoguttaceae bacterium]
MALAAVLLAGGCSRPAEPAAPPVGAAAAGEPVASAQQPPADGEPVAAAQQSAASEQPQAAAGPADRETWDLYRMKGTRVGYGRTSIRRPGGPQPNTVQVEGLVHFGVERLGQRTEQEIRFTDTETPEGALLDFQFEVRQGPTPVKTSGRVVGKRLELETVSLGQRRRESTAWSAGDGGPSAPELSLLRRPMQAGQTRRVRHLGIENQVEEIELTARTEETVELPTGKFRLLRIDTLERLAGGQKIRGAVWTDPAGDVLKSWIEPMDMEVFRVPKALALAETGPARLDLTLVTLVPLVTTSTAEALHAARRVGYRVHLEGADPAEVFPEGRTQRVRRIDAHTAEVTVYAVHPEGKEGNPAARGDAPTRADRQPNNFIQSDDPLIVAQAREAAGRESDPWRVAVALERYVHQAVTLKDFSQAFATAADVARSHEGDCTEHAVLLAALARARGIPARVAIGLLVMPRGHALGYHMWTEAFIADRWIPLDGTLARGGIGGGHLKLAHSSLEGSTAYSSLMPVIQVIGRLQVAVVEVQPK